MLPASGALRAASRGSERSKGERAVFRAYAALALIGRGSDRLHRYATSHHTSRAIIATAMTTGAAMAWRPFAFFIAHVHATGQGGGKRRVIFV